MSIKYETRYAADPKAVKGYDTDMLREAFLINNLMISGEIKLVYSHYDRYIAGSAVPVNEPLSLEPIDPLKASYFLERRELGIINVGGAGEIIAGEETFSLTYKEALYIGRGVKKVIFKSDDNSNPAKFYLNSAPAHHDYPNKKVTQDQAQIVELGSLEASNARTIRKLIVNGLVDTCQLQMGMTELKPGSIWNTMPAHVHDRRMEVYFYFEIPDEQAVCHFMGTTDETRHIWLKNENAVISPPWSIHAGAGTSNYIFIWGMAGENLDYGDMDVCSVTALK